MAENFSDPFIRIPVAAARVSTLLTTVGFLYNPSVTGKGGLTSTSALLPSIDAINAVSSPHTVSYTHLTLTTILRV